LAFPESDEPRILQAAAALLAENCVGNVTFFTPKAATLTLAGSLGLDLESFAAKIIWADHQAAGEPTALNYAASLLKQNKVTAVVAGAATTTAAVIRAGIAGVGLASGVRTVSGAFFMYKKAAPKHQLLLFADSGVVIAPTIQQLVDIASESIKSWRSLVTTAPPVVAFLSYSTKGSATHESTVRVAEALALFKQRHPDVAADGEMQFDAAIDPEICARKAPGSAVAGAANCLIFPDLNAGNIAYKIAQRLGGYEAYGPILQGLNQPFSDLSRGSTVSDIVMSACVNLLRAP
jgi:phosphate acetyltransferase